ncbi:SPFH domain-containing protein [Yaniella flava]|uniref:SPFH domain-containing protein n=1 Tax=Yaniella flava TaxID=287930 RepID=A0ABP5G2M3_9MICC|nr:SPFH/Band 7/PHB domain protein [Micrococcaceae bacterium]
MGAFLTVLFIVLAVFVVAVLVKSFRIVSQGYSGIIQRLGKYHRTQNAGLTLMVPFVDKMLPLIDVREQVVSFPPQPVITEDNLVVSIDTVVYFQVNDPATATYGIADYISAVENLTTTTLRNVVGSMDLEDALTSRDEINTRLRGVLDEATSQWGLRVSRVELKSIDPPESIQRSMEQQMRAERDRRAAILTAEGQKQSDILTAEGKRQAAILEAEGDKESSILEAEGAAEAKVLEANAEAEATKTVFDAIHEGKPDNELLAYQYIQALPKIADSESSKLWIIPSEVTNVISQLGELTTAKSDTEDAPKPPETPGRPPAPTA